MHGHFLSIVSLAAGQLILAVWLRSSCRHVDSLERRLRVLEGLLGCRGLLPEPPREAESGVEQLRVANTEDGTW